jgi:hypothetical protein
MNAAYAPGVRGTSGHGFFPCLRRADSAILGRVTDQVAGILLGVFSVIMLGVLFAGGFAETKRFTGDSKKK